MPETTKEILATMAVLLSIVGNIPYLLSVIEKKVTPHPYTWLIWSIVSGTIFFGQVVGGAGIGAIPTAVSEMFTIIIFFFSLQYGWKGVVKKDNYFLITALLGIIPWILTKDPTLSVIIMVSIDFVAFIPTLRKTWYHPETEIPLLYGTNALRHFLTLFSVHSYNVATMLHSVVMVCVNTVMTYFILRKGNKNS